MRAVATDYAALCAACSWRQYDAGGGPLPRARVYSAAQRHRLTTGHAVHVHAMRLYAGAMV